MLKDIFMQSTKARQQKEEEALLGCKNKFKKQRLIFTLQEMKPAGDKHCNNSASIILKENKHEFTRNDSGLRFIVEAVCYGLCW